MGCFERARPVCLVVACQNDVAKFVRLPSMGDSSSQKHPPPSDFAPRRMIWKDARLECFSNLFRIVHSFSWLTVLIIHPSWWEKGVFTTHEVPTDGLLSARRYIAVGGAIHREMSAPRMQSFTNYFHCSVWSNAKNVKICLLEHWKRFRLVSFKMFQSMRHYFVVGFLDDVLVAHNRHALQTSS